MKPFAFNESMNEVSGFGGFYERCCRVGVCAGAEWCALHPGVVPKFSEVPDVFGLIDAEDPHARALWEAIFSTLVSQDDGVKVPLRAVLTGAQTHAITHHVLYIASYGWKRYVEERMSEPLAVYNQDGERDESSPA